MASVSHGWVVRRHGPLGALLVYQQVGEDCPLPLSHLYLVTSDLYQVGVSSDDDCLCGH